MSPPRVVIIGGGISGLSVAHRLVELSRGERRPLDIAVLESQCRFGGVIETVEREGFVLEGGPDAFLAEKPWARDLCRRVGLEHELIGTQRECRRSFIVQRGKLVPVPEGFYLIAPSSLPAVFHLPFLSWRGRLRMACEPFVPARAHGQDESVGGFIRRRFGREALARIGQPMIAGIYTADPDRLSLQATMPAFQAMERRYGSVIRALRARASNGQPVAARPAQQGGTSGPRYGLFLSLRRGMGSLVEALLREMPGVALHASSPVTRIAPSGRVWEVTFHAGRTLHADLLCLALPADKAAALLAPCAPDLARQLAGIPYESVATVNLGFRRAELPQAPAGFGFVVPASERRRLVGCTCSSAKFPGRAPQGMVLLRAFVGGALHRELFHLDDAAMTRMVREELRELLGIRADPVVAAVHRYPHAMPQYHVGHLARVAAVEETLQRHPGLFLVGNGFRGLGLPDCIRHAEQTAERMLVG
jgi:oxygen-dependent protoporphyrinogen oxidase